MSRFPFVSRRHRRPVVSAATEDPSADIAQLISDLGKTDADVPAFYDVRAGVTATSTLSQWDDARGPTGFGPSFTIIDGTAPAWDGSAKTLTGNIDGAIRTATSPKFDLTSVKALVYVGSVVGAGVPDKGYACAIVDSASFNRGLGINGAAINSEICATAGGGGTVNSVSSAVASSTTRRVVLVTLSSTTMRAQVPNHTAGSTSTGAATSGDNALTLGNYWTNAGTTERGIYTARALFCLTFVPDATQSNTIRDWGITAHSAVAAS